MAGVTVITRVMIGRQHIHKSERGKRLQSVDVFVRKDLSGVLLIAWTQDLQVCETGPFRAGCRPAGMRKLEDEESRSFRNRYVNSCLVGGGVVSEVLDLGIPFSACNLCLAGQ